MMNKYIIIIYSILTSVIHSQGYGSITFTNYAEDRKAAFSLTFDDGLLTHSTNVRPILNQHGFKGTFYVLPPYLAEDNQPLIWRYGYWSDFQNMASEDHEIGSHTMNHFDLTTLPWGSISDDSTLLYEIYQSKIFIEQKIPSEKCISLNYPYTLHNSLVDSAASLFYENGRTLGQTANDSSLTSSEWFNLKAKVVEFNLPRNSVDDDLDELYTFLDWTQNAIDNHQWGMIIVHDVVPFSSLDSLIGLIYQPITNEWLEWLCNWLEVKSLSNDLWVETVGNVTRYIKQRDAAEYQIITSTDQLIEINITDNLNNQIYDYPLSGYVKIPDSWNYVRVQQNNRIDTLGTIQNESGKFVLVKVIPDYGIVKLSPVTSTNITDENSVVSEFSLSQNYPNPFNPSTLIQFTLGIRQFITLKVYDMLGKEVAVLVNDYKNAGSYSVEFNVDDLKLSSGIYFYRIQAGSSSSSLGIDFVETKKMIYLK